MTVTRLPTPPLLSSNEDPARAKYDRDLSRTLHEELLKRTPDIEGRDSITLVAPDRTIWEVRVTNLGALTVTKVLG